MRNKTLAIKKVGVICLVLIVAMGFLGVSYGKWTQNLDVAASVTTGASPEVTTIDASSIGSTTATLNAELTGLGAGSEPITDNLYFVYGTTSNSYGTPVAGSPPSTTSAPTAYTASLMGLTPSTTYYFRAKVVGVFTAYGNELEFTTSAPSPAVYFSSASFYSNDATGNVTPSGSSINTQTLTIAATPTNMGIPKQATVTCTITNNSGEAIVCTGIWSPPHDTNIDSVVFSGAAFGSSIANGATASGTITVTWSQQKDILLNATVTFSHVP